MFTATVPHAPDLHSGYAGVVVDDLDCPRCALIGGSLTRLSKEEFAELWNYTHQMMVLHADFGLLSQADRALIDLIYPVQVMLERFGWPLGNIPEIQPAARSRLAGMIE